MIRKFVIGLVVAATAAAAVVVPSTSAGASRPTIAGIVSQSGGEGQFDRNPFDYDILLNAVIAADLVGALNGSTELTVFAPDDAAFMRTARDLGFTGRTEKQAFDFLAGALGENLPTVLLYHVAPGRLGPLQVLFSGHIDTLAQQSFGVRGLRLIDKGAGPDPFLNLFALDIKASNGVIHGITRVLVPALPA